MIDFDRVHSVADIFRVQADKNPDAIAQIFEGQETTYKELYDYGCRVAQGMIAEGCKPDTRVGFMGKNSDSYFEVLAGSALSNTVIVGVNWRLAPKEVAYVLKDAKAEILFVGAEYYELIEGIKGGCPDLRTIIAMDGGHAAWPSYKEWRDSHEAKAPDLSQAPENDVIQLYTSGTTGYPKGVQLTNHNYVEVLKQAVAAGWGDWEVDEGNLVCMPIFHVAGVNVGVIGFAHGCKNVVMKEVDPAEIIRLVETYKIGILFMVPAVILFVTMLPDIDKADLSSVRVVIYGASPIAEDLLLKAQEIFKCDFIQVYGLTETTGGATFLPPEDHDPARGKLRSCGKVSPGIEIRTVDEDGKTTGVDEVGEIVLRAKCVMKGYWNRPDATKDAIRDGWFYTGDAGYFDDDGYLYIHDRVKDMIVSGGENIYPAEVENALFSHPSIADVAVVGVPDEKWGEAVKAFVVLKPEESATEADIIEFARTHIAGYKIPKSIDFVEMLPRNPTGKVLRRELRAPYWEGHDRQVS
ncbi:MAG: long-chain-fatty-acid--CoA ligase [Parvularculales bacterium]